MQYYRALKGQSKRRGIKYFCSKCGIQIGEVLSKMFAMSNSSENLLLSKHSGMHTAGPANLAEQSGSENCKSAEAVHFFKRGCSSDMMCHMQKCHGLMHGIDVNTHSLINGTLFFMANHNMFPKHPMYTKIIIDDGQGSHIALGKSFFERDLQIKDKEPFNLLNGMQMDNEQVTKHTVKLLLKSCRSLKCKEGCCKLHDLIIKVGFDNDFIISSALVDLYGKSGEVAHAQEVFESMPKHDTVVWSSLIAAYSEYGDSSKIMECFRRMQREGSAPNSVTYLCSLKACVNVEQSDLVRQIHIDIVRHGFEVERALGSALVDAYANCVSILEAWVVLNRLPEQDAISWTSMMIRLVEEGFGSSVLDCLKVIQERNMQLDAVTYMCGLKACAALESSIHGREVHNDIVKVGLDLNLTVSNALIDMYAKCGLLIETHKVFSKVPEKDVVSWNSLISGCVEHGLNSEALNCFEQMQLLCVAPSTITYVSVLKACDSLSQVQGVHMVICKLGFERNKYIGSTLVDIYANFGHFLEAGKLFDELPVQNVFCWTALIAGFIDFELAEEALQLVGRMLSSEVPVDAITMACSLKGCGMIKALDLGYIIHMFIVMEGMEDPYITDVLVDMYVKCLSLSDAAESFDKMTWRGPRSWITFLNGFLDQGFYDEAVECLKIMQDEDVHIDTSTFIFGLKVCAVVGALERGQWLHISTVKCGLNDDVVIGNTLVDMYAKCGSLAESQVIQLLIGHNTIGWTALITGYASQGDFDNVLQLFNRMREKGLKIDKVTFLSLLNVCSHVGLVEKGWNCFYVLCESYKSFLCIDHLNGMIDLFSRAGQLNSAVMIMDKMPFQPDDTTWHTLLGACRKWANVDFGKLAFEGAMGSSDYSESAFILMSNIYADEQMWEGVQMIESIRRGSSRSYSMDYA